MFMPTSHPCAEGDMLGSYLTKRGVSRRDFVAFCGEMTAVLGLSSALTPKVAAALAAVKRPSVIRLQLQECTGCVESVVRTAEPTIGDLVLDVVSLDYQHTLMAAAGHAVEKALADTIAANKGANVLLVTGSIPKKENGVYCTIGGRTAEDILVETARDHPIIKTRSSIAGWKTTSDRTPPLLIITPARNSSLPFLLAYLHNLRIVAFSFTFTVISSNFFRYRTGR